MDLKNSKQQNPIVGIIAEDMSDIKTAKKIINLISGKNVTIKPSASEGCAKLMRKCKASADQFWAMGCKMLIIIHDSDENNPQGILQKIEQKIKPCPFEKYLVCVPVQEIEAWLLSDPNAIKKAMGLAKLPRISGMPEDINSPKDFLRQLVSKASSNRITYVNTIHNDKIASYLNIDTVKKRCPSFLKFYKFIKDNI